MTRRKTLPPSAARRGPSRSACPRLASVSSLAADHQRRSTAGTSGAPCPAASSDGSGSGPGCWSSRPRRSRTRVPQGSPSNTRAYRSSATAALVAKCGSRGRSTSGATTGGWRHGASIRHTVAAEIAATTARLTSSRASSAQLQRDSGTPVVAGSSQASCLTSAMTRGGKGPGSTRAFAIGQARHALLEEALAPLDHRVQRHLEPLGDLPRSPSPRPQPTRSGPESPSAAQPCAGEQGTQVPGDPRRSSRSRTGSASTSHLPAMRPAQRSAQPADYRLHACSSADDH